MRPKHIRYQDSERLTGSLNIGVDFGVESVPDGGDAQSRERGRRLELVNVLRELMAVRLRHQIVDSRVGKAKTVETFDESE